MSGKKRKPMQVIAQTNSTKLATENGKWYIIKQNHKSEMTKNDAHFAFINHLGLVVSKIGGESES